MSVLLFPLPQSQVYILVLPVQNQLHNPKIIILKRGDSKDVVYLIIIAQSIVIIKLIHTVGILSRSIEVWDKVI